MDTHTVTIWNPLNLLLELETVICLFNFSFVALLLLTYFYLLP